MRTVIDVRSIKLCWDHHPYSVSSGFNRGLVSDTKFRSKSLRKAVHIRSSFSSRWQKTRAPFIKCIHFKINLLCNGTAKVRVGNCNMGHRPSLIYRLSPTTCRTILREPLELYHLVELDYPWRAIGAKRT